MKNEIALDVRKLPYWDGMHKEVRAILGAHVRDGADASSTVLAAAIFKHIAIACLAIDTPEADRFMTTLLDIAQADLEYPDDDESKLDPQSPDDPSAKWDNRRSVH